MSIVLGIDIGTYEAKGVLVDVLGRIIARHRRPHHVTIPEPGQVEHNPEMVWWQGFVHVTRDLIATSEIDPDQIDAVCVSGIGPCVLPIDHNGDPLRNAILYGVDSRASTQIDQLSAMLGLDEIKQRSGTFLTSQSAGPKITWLEQNEPDIFSRTALFVTCQTFIVGRLTGRWIIDHATAAYFQPFYDLRTLDWNLDGYDGALTTDHLPELGWSGDIAERVTAAASELTGLRAGTPVLVGAPDAPVEALSAGVIEDRQMMLMYGSSHFMIEVVKSLPPIGPLWPAPYLFPDTFLMAAGTATAGSFTRWFADLLSPELGGSDEFYEQLTALALQSPPGAKGLLALPYLSGERTPLFDPGARGGFLGLSMQHTRGDLARAVVEAIAQSAAAALRVFDQEGITPTVIRATGGGTKNTAWIQAITDITGREQEVASGPGACYGDAMLAAISVGYLSGPDDIGGWTKPTHVVVPRPELADLYVHQRSLFESFYESSRSIVTELSQIRTE